MLEWNPIKKFEEEGIAIVSEANGKANATSSHFGGVGRLWNKNVAYIFVRESRYTVELLDNSETFSACFFDMEAKANKQILKILDALSGRNEDKLAECKITLAHAMDVPYIDEANFLILCKKLAKVHITPNSILENDIMEKFYAGKHAGDNHIMYIGEILDIRAR